MGGAGLAWRILGAALGLALAWRAIEVDLVAYDPDGRPRTARLDPVRRLAANPADAGALLMLAREAEGTGQDARAGEAYRAALALAPLDRPVLTAASGHFLAAGDPLGLELLFRLVASYPAVWPRAFPLLAQTLAEPRDRAAWSTIVAGNPSWLPPFVADACGRGVEPALLAPLVVPRAARRIATAPEGACLVSRLRDADRWEEAYLLWLGLLPRERTAQVGFVFNGGFEFAPSGAGFDWIPQPAPERDAGHVAEAVAAVGAEGRRALRVAYNGKRQAGVPVRQFLVLAPGDYRLTGLARVESIKALKGVRWTVRCVHRAAPGAPIAASERFVGSAEWRAFEVPVRVDGDCPGQVLQLEPVVEPGTPAFVAGIAWFDNIALERLP